MKYYILFILAVCVCYRNWANPPNKMIIEEYDRLDTILTGIMNRKYTGH